MKNFKFDLGTRTLVCGILNITPDSFSDGGLWDEPEKALVRACQMQAQGADIIDVGAQSTRPGAQPLGAEEESERLLPVLRLLREKITVPISVDTFYPECAKLALENGASVINDVSGKVDDAMAKVVSQYGAGWIIMHNPSSADKICTYSEGVVKAVGDFFREAADKAEAFGIPRESLCFDIGVGFSKSYEDNLMLIKNIGQTRVAGAALMSAVSRKRVIGEASGEKEPSKRDPGTVAAHTVSILSGADIVRVHDVFSAVQAAKVADAIKRF